MLMSVPLSRMRYHFYAKSSLSIWHLHCLSLIIQLQKVVPIISFLFADARNISQKPSVSRANLQLLVLQLALQLLRLHHLAHRLVEVVLIDRFPVVFDRK